MKDKNQCGPPPTAKKETWKKWRLCKKSSKKKKSLLCSERIYLSMRKEQDVIKKSGIKNYTVLKINFMKTQMENSVEE